MHKINYLLFLFFLAFISCEGDYFPKERTYFRIDFPQKKYIKNNNSELPFTFKTPTYSVVEIERDSSEFIWFNLYYKPFNGYVHMTYKNFSSFQNYNELREDARKFVYKHTVKADEIKETRINKEKEKKYGVYYELEGNVASAMQFYVTDKEKHYVRGALYFKARANRDSLEPVINFVKKDVFEFLKSLEWRN